LPTYNDSGYNIGMTNIDTRVAELGLTLPAPPKPMATYATAVRLGELLYVSGTGPLNADGSYVTGRLGAELDVAAGQAAARLCALAMLATVRANAGSLDRVARLVKVLGFVNATPEFGDHPKVMNGFSDLMVQLFGDAGLGARSAVGAPSLPSGIAVEVEAIFQLR
jgi:enamine deaminase RidA (YjgF/YER057c/UK114 family)